MLYAAAQPSDFSLDREGVLPFSCYFIVRRLSNARIVAGSKKSVVCCRQIHGGAVITYSFWPTSGPSRKVQRHVKGTVESSKTVS